jgi:hypothetical protein
MAISEQGIGIAHADTTQASDGASAVAWIVIILVIGVLWLLWATLGRIKAKAKLHDSAAHKGDVPPPPLPAPQPPPVLTAKLTTLPPPPQAKVLPARHWWNARTWTEVDTVTDYFAKVAQNMTFPDIPAPEVHLRQGEFAVLRRVGCLYEVRSHRASVGVGVRVARGVYVGGRQSIPDDRLDKTADGLIFVTNQRLLFISASTTIICQYRDILSLSSSLSRIQLNTSKRRRPVVLEFPNVPLAKTLIELFMAHPFSTKTIPSGMEIKTEPTAVLGEVRLQVIEGGV